MRDSTLPAGEPALSSGPGPIPGTPREPRPNALPLVVGALGEAPLSDVEHLVEDEGRRTPTPGAETPAAPRGLVARLRAVLSERARELVKFGSVGALSFVVDMGLFNLLQFGPGHLLDAKPVTARVVSVAVATLVAWVGNRLWTFSERRTENRSRELAGFVVVNVGGLLIGIGVLALFVYVLHLDTALWKNVANVLGIGLGTIFRYFAYRHLVFTGDRNDPSDAS